MHQKSGRRLYTPGNFESYDEQFRSRSRGGEKRKYPTIEMLITKRVTPPTELDDCHSWFFTQWGLEQNLEVLCKLPFNQITL